MNTAPNRTRGLLASAALLAFGHTQPAAVDSASARLPEAKGPGSVSGAVVIPGSGHWVAEEAPEQLLAALRAFLAPYRDGPTSAR